MDNASNTLDESFVSMQEERPVPVSSSVRFANMLLDIVFYYIFVFILALIVGMLFGNIEESALLYLFTFGIYVLYYTILENQFGKTFGKMITGTKVVTEDGQKPTLKAILARTFSRFIPFEAFSFLGSRTGWHDTISKTMVVKSHRVSTM